MNVTQEIQQNHIVYGASDYTAPAGLAASKSLNYAKGPTIIHPDRTSVGVIPYTLRYADSVGLFGAENYFLRVDVDVQTGIAKACFEEPGWECAYIDWEFSGFDSGWDNADIEGLVEPEVNTYESANILENKLPRLPQAYVSVHLENIKTNNRFIDDWLDIRLYTSEREEHPYQTMYIKGRTHFYIGVHARNTKRLPYDIICTVGREYRNYESIDNKKLIMREGLK